MLGVNIEIRDGLVSIKTKFGINEAILHNDLHELVRRKSKVIDKKIKV